MKPTVTKKDFLNWYFDYDTKRVEGLDLINELIKYGSISKTTESYFENCGYIPANICENLTEEQEQDEDLEFDPSEVTLID